MLKPSPAFKSFALAVVFFWIALSGSLAGCQSETDRGDSLIQAKTGAQKVEKIYLHWTAGSYDCPGISSYHTLVKGDGTIQNLVDYNTGLSGHTYVRNHNSASISACCMGGVLWVTYPCKEIQVEKVAEEAAKLALKLGWSQSDITVKKVLTHAEAGSNRDYSRELAVKLNVQKNEMSAATAMGLPHDNYGPEEWHDGWPGGLSMRWDWAQTKKTDRMGEGGEILRKKIIEKMSVSSIPSIPAVVDVCDEIATELGIL